MTIQKLDDEMEEEKKAVAREGRGTEPVYHEWEKVESGKGQICSSGTTAKPLHL